VNRKLAHCYQVQYSARKMVDFGLVDGEDMERLWSYLRPLAHITREMTPSCRQDVLTDALLQYTR
jgi:hypothetical protein